MKSIAIPAGLLLAGTAGHAQPATMVVAETPYTGRMGYQPSALASEDGLRGLKSRVRRAARRVCELGIDIPTAKYRERSCYNATLPDAFAQVDAAVVRLAEGERRAARIVVR